MNSGPGDGMTWQLGMLAMSYHRRHMLLESRRRRAWSGSLCRKNGGGNSVSYRTVSLASYCMTFPKLLLSCPGRKQKLGKSNAYFCNATVASSSTSDLVLVCNNKKNDQLYEISEITQPGSNHVAVYRTYVKDVRLYYNALYMASSVILQ